MVRDARAVPALLTMRAERVERGLKESKRRAVSASLSPLSGHQGQKLLRLVSQGPTRGPRMLPVVKSIEEVGE